MHFVEKEPSQKRIDFDNKLKSNKIDLAENDMQSIGNLTN